MYSYIWIEGEENFLNFCMKRFRSKPTFRGTIGYCGIASVQLIYKHRAEDEPQGSGCHEMYFLYMETDNGQYNYPQLQDIMRLPYEKIRTDKTAILRKRG